MFFFFWCTEKMEEGKTQNDENNVRNLPVLRLPETTYKGVVTYCFELPEIEKMEIRDDDIWVCSFPRSGKSTLSSPKVAPVG